MILSSGALSTPTKWTHQTSAVLNGLTLKEVKAVSLTFEGPRLLR